MERLSKVLKNIGINWEHKHHFLGPLGNTALLRGITWEHKQHFFRVTREHSLADGNLYMFKGLGLGVGVGGFWVWGGGGFRGGWGLGGFRQMLGCDCVMLKATSNCLLKIFSCQDNLENFG